MTRKKTTIQTQVCVVGAGAGGTGCVYRLIKNGVKTVVIDKYSHFGGTSVFCGVDGWEPGVTLDGIHELLRRELEKTEKACHVVATVPNSNFFDPSAGNNWDTHSLAERPWGYSIPIGHSYEDTLKCCPLFKGTDRAMVRFQFEPEEMKEAILRVLQPYREHLTTLFCTQYRSCVTEEGRIKSITVSGEEGDTEILADYFVDASGDIVLARDAGCGYDFGCEGQEEYNEPSAAERNGEVNGVSYVFRVARTEDPRHIDEIPQDVKSVDISDWTQERMKRTKCCFVLYPNGDININMLPTIDGKDYFQYGGKADEIGRARVYAYWHYLQKEKHVTGYTLQRIFDAGVRESYRLKGKYVLKEQDLRLGWLRQPKPGRTVAIADHALDAHGKNRLARILDVPYEIPVECAMTKEFDNLFVACRGASFTHIASTSVRLIRTMLSMGEGVGEYISERIKTH